LLSRDGNKHRNCGVEIDVREELNHDHPVICDINNLVDEPLPSMWKTRS
jgi:hypothetical protein